MLYIFICDKVDISGGELLLERIAKELLARGNRIRFCYRWISEEMLNRLNNDGFETILIHQWKSNIEFFKGVDKDHEIRILTLRWDYYCRFSNLKRKKCKTLLYIVHPMTAITSPDRSKFIKYVAISLVKPFLLKHVIEGNVVYMDEDCKNTMVNYYGVPSSIANNIKLIRISVDIPSIQKFETK